VKKSSLSEPGQLRIFITVSEEPVYINPFIKKLIHSLHHEIVGIGIQQGKSAVAGKTLGRKIKYLFSLSIISEPWNLLKRAVIFGCFLFFERIAFTGIQNPLSVGTAARYYNIPVIQCKNINSRDCIEFLKAQDLDVIINQAQIILSKDFIEVPRIGCLNRHAALLPKYRGRLAPFWAYVNGEKESGLSIHFIDEKLDNGPILVQEPVPIKRLDTVDTLLDRIFLEIAPEAMLKALELIRSGEYEDHLIDNDDSKASCFSSPGVKDALRYRRVVLRRWIIGI
jgi:methionyl-tRNA formyltransferase